MILFDIETVYLSVYVLSLLQLEAEREGEEGSGEEEGASPPLGDAEQCPLLALTCSVTLFLSRSSLLCLLVS